MHLPSSVRARLLGGGTRASARTKVLVGLATVACCWPPPECSRRACGARPQRRRGAAAACRRRCRAAHGERQPGVREPRAWRRGGVGRAPVQQLPAGDHREFQRRAGPGADRRALHRRTRSGRDISRAGAGAGAGRPRAGERATGEGGESGAAGFDHRARLAWATLRSSTCSSAWARGGRLAHLGGGAATTAGAAAGRHIVGERLCGVQRRHRDAGPAICGRQRRPGREHPGRRRRAEPGFCRRARRACPTRT